MPLASQDELRKLVERIVAATQVGIRTTEVEHQIAQAQRNAMHEEQARALQKIIDDFKAGQKK